MIKCSQCGAPNTDGRDKCYNCDSHLVNDPSATVNPAASAATAVPGVPVMPLPSLAVPKAHAPLSREWIAVILGLLLLFVFAFHSRTYEYKVVVIESQRNEYGEGALKVVESSFADLGRRGWELVGVLPDVETSFPNFGDAEYHTGIKSNTHTKSAHLLFKRSRWLFGLL